MMIGHGDRDRQQRVRRYAEWVETHYTPQTVYRVLIYDLTQPQRNS